MKSSITCDMEGRILTMNDAAEIIFGYKKEELIAEIITHKLGGINIISCYFENELDNETSKYIMTSIQNILQKEQLSEQ